MAERTVNVNINYNVRTGEIEKLAQASQRAQAATDRLQESAQKFSTQTTQGTKQAATSIEGMRIQMQRLKAQIDLTNQADTKRLNSLIGQYREVKKRVDDFNRSLHETQKATTETNARFGGLLSTVKAVFTVAVARQIIDMSLSMARLAGNVEGVERAFQNTFPNAELLLEDLRRHTHGVISDFELMQKTLLAKNLGVGVERLGTIMEFVSTRAQQTGQNVDVLLDKFIRGIGVKSPRLLDDLGISSLRLQESLDGVSLSAISIGDFTERVADIAQVELGKMGGYAETAATKVSQIEVQYESLRVALAKRITSTALLDFFNDVLKGGEALIKAFDLSATISGTIDSLRELAVAEEAHAQALLEVDRLTKGLQGTEQERFDVVQQGINSNIQTIGKYNDEIKKFQAIADRTKGFGFPGFNKENIEGAKRFNELTEQFGNKARDIFLQETENAQKAIAHYEFRKVVIEETIRLLGQYLGTIKEINEGEAVRPSGLIEKLEEQIAGVQERIKQATVAGTIFDGSGNLVRPVVGSIADLNRELEIMQGRLSDLKKTGLPEFKSPEIFERISKLIEEDFKQNAEKVTQEFINIEEVIARIDNQLRNLPTDTIKPPPTITPTTFGDELLDSLIANQQELINQSLDITTGYLQEVAFAEVEAYETRIDALQTFYDQQILLAGDNERAKDQLRLQEARSIENLRRQQAIKDKQARRFSVVIDTAASVARTAANLGFPAAIPFIALALAQGALQLAAINKAQPGFKEGGLITGKGTGTSDSIPIMASNREYMVNADSTSKSFRLLEAINAKKIDDRILSDIRGIPSGNIKVVQMDARPIIEAINKQKYPDLVREGSTIWEARKVGDSYKRYVRSKSMSK